MLLAKIRGEFQTMAAWFAAPLALIFALATLSVPPSIKAEKENSEQTDQSRPQEKSGKADESSSTASKGRRHHRPERHE
jgi:choline-glycine betaine transporter